MNEREQDRRLCNELLAYDRNNAVCSICGYIWANSFIEQALDPENEIGRHMRYKHVEVVARVLGREDYRSALRRSMDAVAAQLAGEGPPNRAWAWYPLGVAPTPARKKKGPPKIKSEEAPAALAEAEAILTLSLPLTWHLKFGCQCARCMDVFIACYDGFEAVFEEGDPVCPVDKKESE